MKRRGFIVGLSSAGVTLATQTPVFGRGDLSDLELDLCLDSTSSMFTMTNHWSIQRDGHLDALDDAMVKHLLIQQRVYVRLLYWSDNDIRNIHMPFSDLVSDEVSYQRLRETISTFRMPNTELLTSHSTLLNHLRSLPMMGKRRVVDISTDEPVWPEDIMFCVNARNQLEKEGVQVNVIAVEGGYKINYEPVSLKNSRRVTDSMEENVQTRSPEGFTYTVRGWHTSTYTEALISKLKRELM